MAEVLSFDFQNCFILVLPCLLLFVFFFFKKQKNGYDLPPSPPSLPIIGHLHLLLSTLIHRSLQKLSSRYGPLLYVRIFRVPIILVSSASVAYDIFKAHDVNISSRENSPIDESPLVGGPVFVTAPYGEYWKFMRKLLVTKLLGSQALERSRSIRADELERFYMSLLDKARKSESAEIFKEATKLSNSIWRMCMGRTFSEENNEAERIWDLVTELDALSTKIILANLLRKPLQKLGFSLFKKEMTCVSNRFNEVLERILVEHEETMDMDQGWDMMDVLLVASRDENTEHGISRSHIKSLFLELFFIGNDTSAHVIQWTMAEIINNSNVLERLREEIETVVGKIRLIQEADLPNLPYLQAIVKEGLRLHPPLPIFVRKVQEGCTMGGFYIPEKTTLVFNSYAVMRDPDSWEDPDQFKPERFLVSSSPGNEDERREKALKYIPSGSGRRGCPGSNLANIFIGTALGMMVQCFDWRIKGDKVNMEEAGGLILSMAHPLTCTPVARAPPLLANLHIPSSQFQESS